MVIHIDEEIGIGEERVAIGGVPRCGGRWGLGGPAVRVGRQ